MTKKWAAEPWEEEEEVEEEEGRRIKKKETVKLINAACLCTLRTFNK